MLMDFDVVLWHCEIDTSIAHLSFDSLVD